MILTVFTAGIRHRSKPMPDNLAQSHQGWSIYKDAFEWRRTNLDTLLILNNQPKSVETEPNLEYTIQGSFSQGKNQFRTCMAL